jgi:hypothetical protein
MLVVQRVQRVATNVTCCASAATLVSICVISLVKPELQLTYRKILGAIVRCCSCKVKTEAMQEALQSLSTTSIEHCSVVNNVIRVTL